jgi:hypothetical protein
MKTLAITIVAALALSGCAQLKSWVPSFWDDNQSRAIIDVRQAVAEIDCGQPQLVQAQRLTQRLQWFELYSESKGWRQADVLRVIKPMQQTASDWQTRSREAEPSKTYCEIKKKLLVHQSSRAAEAVLGRF